MNKTETAGIMAILQVAYPMYYRDKSKEELTVAVNLWHEMFLEDDVELVKAAIKGFIASDTRGFPPVIGQIRQQLQRLIAPVQLCEVAAWDLVSNAIRNGMYGAEEEFAKLPHAIQQSIGSADRLREWSQVDVDDVQTVIASHFMRSYRARLQQEKELAMLPADLRKIGQSQLHLKGEVND